MNLNDQKKIVNHQYKNANILDIRISLHQEYSTNKYGWHRWVFDQLLEIDPNSKLLEVGSGNGELWLKNIDRIPKEWDVTLSDVSIGMLNKAKECMKDQIDVQFEIFDVQSIPFLEKSFDVVMANHMLYHMSDLSAVLSELKRVLRPGGVFYATTVGINNMQKLRDLVFEFDPLIEFPFGTAAKVFGLENGASKLQSYFENIEIRYYEDSLKITDVEPLVNYVLSFTGMGNVQEIIRGEKLEKFKKFIQSKMDQDGCINISKAVGVFVAK